MVALESHRHLRQPANFVPDLSHTVCMRHLLAPLENLHGVVNLPVLILPLCNCPLNVLVWLSAAVACPGVRSCGDAKCIVKQFKSVSGGCWGPFSGGKAAEIRKEWSYTSRQPAFITEVSQLPDAAVTLT